VEVNVYGDGDPLEAEADAAFSREQNQVVFVFAIDQKQPSLL
jgi:hypothetical protein